MALKSKILQEFFHATKPPVTPKNEIINADAVTEQASSGIKPHTHFKIFDNPLEESHHINLGQSSDKLRTELRTKFGQSSDKANTNLGHSKPIRVKTQDKLKTQPRTELRTKFGQSSDKANSLTTFSSLVGLQREIVLFIYEQCKLSRDKITAALSIEHLAISCKTTRLSAQKTTQRLEKKQVIIRGEYKNGRGGWTRYGLSEPIFQEVLHTETHDKFRANLGQSSDKLRSEPRTEPRTSDSSSSSSLNIKRTTTTSDSNVILNEWQTVDIEPLAEFGFTQTHLTQIAQQGKLSVDIVQTSIYAFAFDLKHNNKAKTLKTDAINFFMGIVRNGKPYAPPSNYYSPQEEAMRHYVERQREIEQKRAELEKAAIELAFSEWLTTLSEDDKKRIIPHFVSNLKTEAPKLSALRDHFVKEIWPTKHVQITQQIT